jgi:hypothetical protein
MTVGEGQTVLHTRNLLTIRVHPPRISVTNRSTLYTIQ